MIFPEKEASNYGHSDSAFPFPDIEPGGDPEVHTVDIQGVLPGDFCGISVNQFSGPGGAVEILKDVVSTVIQGPGPYTIRHTVTLHRATDEVVVCNVVGVLIHQP